MRKRTEILQHTQGVFIEAGGKRTGHGEEATAETPVNAVHVEGSAEGPTPWNRKFREADHVYLSELVQETLLVLYNFEDAVIQPEKSLRCSMFQGSMDKFHLGIHEGVELLRVLLWGTMGRKSTLIGHGLLVALEVCQREGHDRDVGKVGEQTELWDKGWVREQENRDAAQGQVIEEVQVFIKALWLLGIDGVVAGDDHARGFYFVGGGKSADFRHVRP